MDQFLLYQYWWLTWPMAHTHPVWVKLVSGKCRAVTGGFRYRVTHQPSACLHPHVTQRKRTARGVLTISVACGLHIPLSHQCSAQSELICLSLAGRSRPSDWHGVPHPAPACTTHPFCATNSPRDSRPHKFPRPLSLGPYC